MNESKDKKITQGEQLDDQSLDSIIVVLDKLIKEKSGGEVV